MAMRTLQDWEKVCLLGSSHCPVCGDFVQLHSEQSDENLQTTSGRCEVCNCTYAIDRVNEPPFEILGGHQYGGA